MPGRMVASRAPTAAGPQRATGQEDRRAARPSQPRATIRTLTRRPVLGRGDGWWGGVEGWVDRAGGAGIVGLHGEDPRDGFRPLNPLYHLGSISLLLLILVCTTGIYLVVYYTPDADHAYSSVALASATALGSIIRGVHRYASQALLVALLLHALKMLLGDRFWGPRTLSWLSGWIIFGTCWVVGVMGYWLVWDARAQWLTSYVASMNLGTSLAFASPGEAARNSSLFIIILFLHVFVPAFLLIGVWVHVMRLPRMRLWVPRWLAVEIALLLVGVAWSRPATSGPPADLTRVVGPTVIDPWFLGFLPAVERLGNWTVWGGLTALGIAALTVPFLGRGRTLGPAVVSEPECTGCDLCAQQCPYAAIAMAPRQDALHFPSVAKVDASLCTGCGLCVGVCSTDAIDLPGLPSRQLRFGLESGIGRAVRAGHRPVAIFACARQLQAGTIPKVGEDGTPLVTCPLPCAGMVHAEWVREALAAGAVGALVVSGPHDDCAFREGPAWTHERLQRRHRLQRQGVAWVEAAPGDVGAVRAAVSELVARAAGGASGRLAPEPPPRTARVRAVALVRGFLVAAVPLAVIAALGTAPDDWPTVGPSKGDVLKGHVRMVVAHRGLVRVGRDTNLSQAERSRLPVGVTAAQILGGERHPVRLRLTIGDAAPLEVVHLPGGMQREGPSNGITTASVEPGTHAIQVELMDDGVAWRTVFRDRAGVGPGQVRILTYLPERDSFSLR